LPLLDRDYLRDPVPAAETPGDGGHWVPSSTTQRPTGLIKDASRPLSGHYRGENWAGAVETPCDQPASSGAPARSYQWGEPSRYPTQPSSMSLSDPWHEPQLPASSSTRRPSRHFQQADR
jgi:hypothetical protein